MGVKTAVFIAGGLGGTTVAVVGGSYILDKNGNIQEVKEESDAPQQPSQPEKETEKKLSSDLPFKTLKEFKDGKGGSCAQHYFGELDYIAKSSGRGNSDRTPLSLRRKSTKLFGY